MKSQIIVLCIILTVGYACSPSGLSTTGRQHANANRREKLKDKALEATIRNIQKLNPQACMQCGEVKVTKKECDSYSGIHNKGDCGMDTVTYAMAVPKNGMKVCGKAFVYCTPAYSLNQNAAVIAIDLVEDQVEAVLDVNMPEEESNSTITTTTNTTQEAPHSLVMLTKDEKRMVMTTLLCNNNSKWIVEDKYDKETETEKEITLHCISFEAPKEKP